ncbi:TPA: hypothetical protein MDU36_002448 [Klebsiella pneumoniae]|uniref:hypothetical protein n=1 Tax=Klebsiella quasipneumoniae TaxID=1463165 RepID=UPI0029D7E521|nr:hypothetical protein [Klebsiella quasipneumoniae]HBQ8830777.1 hypothetical protein [Klebsiella pneumoniae]MDX7659611.1 hypothetical protein [Klebsiella quasipneumoniae]HBR2668490.1 hypothetical protein [Klebsiella pneumoniae]HBS7689541.1 hypothetical protein [Klebsiella pneumoniae]HBV3479799.1 hypothetical protein [Klebsiella pneumoniae]
MIFRQRHYLFIREHYKHSRFEGRNDATWGRDYSYRIAQSGLDSLSKYGYGLISQHESKTGEAVYYDRNLNILTDEHIKAALRGELT